MRKQGAYAVVLLLCLSVVVAPTAQAKGKVTKPSAPTISAISSSKPKKGKVNLKVTITLPASNGGSKITGSKVSAGGKSCTIKKTKTSCTIKSIKKGKKLKVTAKSKNKKGFSRASKKVTYAAGSGTYRRATPVASTPVASSPVASSPVAVATTISVPSIAGVVAPVAGATPVTTNIAGSGYTGTVAWSGSPAVFDFATTYTAIITLTPTSGYTLTGVTTNFFTVAGATSVTNSANAGVITAVFPATVATYAVGDPGPGGGIIYYVDNAGFSCGPGYTTTGSPTGGLCKYLEVAPSGWNSGTDPTKVWAIPEHQLSHVPGISMQTDYRDISGIGLGYKNSIAIVDQNGTYNATSNDYAAGAARAYAGNSKNDWYLPTISELNLLCRWHRGQTLIAGAFCSNTIRPGLPDNGSGLMNYTYWTSSVYNAYRAWFVNLTGTSMGGGYNVKDSLTYAVRPVRAF